MSHDLILACLAVGLYLVCREGLKHWREKAKARR